jgi:hypothetical protein
LDACAAAVEFAAACRNEFLFVIFEFAITKKCQPILMRTPQSAIAYMSVAGYLHAPAQMEADHRA